MILLQQFKIDFRVDNYFLLEVSPNSYSMVNSLQILSIMNHLLQPSLCGLLMSPTTGTVPQAEGEIELPQSVTMASQRQQSRVRQATVLQVNRDESWAARRDFLQLAFDQDA